MNYIEELESLARHWEGQSFNDQLAGIEPTPMITIQMTQERWDALKRNHPEERAALDMYKALTELTSIMALSCSMKYLQAHNLSLPLSQGQKALAKANGK